MRRAARIALRIALVPVLLVVTAAVCGSGALSASAPVKRGVPADMPDARGLRPLLYAVINGDVDLARRLLDAGADVDAPEARGERLTPLMIAIINNQAGIFELLLARGADIYRRSANGEWAYPIARHFKRETMAARLRARAVPGDYAGWLVLFPLAGVDGRDWYGNYHFDHQARTCFPQRLSSAAFAALLATQASRKERQAALRRAWLPDGNGFRHAPTIHWLDQEWLRDLLPAAGYKIDLYLPAANRDYAGGTRSYDGHVGTDFPVWHLAQADGSIPVHAAADGTVIRVDDGNPDQNEPGSNNQVFIDHGRGRYTYYSHLMKGIPVRVGQRVRAGEVVGALGSSGGSGPHFHFGIKEWDEWVDPFTGAGNPGPSRFRGQPPYSAAEPTLVPFHGLRDTRVRLKTYVRPDFLRAWRVGDPGIAFTMEFIRARPGDRVTARVLAADGRVHWTNTGVFGTNEAFWAGRWYAMDWIKPTPGEWTMEVAVAGRLVLRAPFTVLAAGAALPALPVPPGPAGAALRRLPGTDRAYRCLVVSGPDAPDPYGDRVRWRYVWTVDGKPVRDVALGSRGDYLAAPATGRVACRVSVRGRGGESAAVAAAAALE